MNPKLFVVGVSHHTAPVEVRERVAVAAEQVPVVLKELLGVSNADELMLLSTCNRFEFYGVGASDAVERLTQWIEARCGIVSATYVRDGQAAIHHIFRVASSLDSMIAGEAQILGQVKDARRQALEVGAIRTVLDRCLQRAFVAAKRVRTETTIAKGSVSVSSVATELAAQIFGDLEGREVVLLGAGKMGEGAARSLTGLGAKLTVVNRSPQKAQSLAERYRAKALAMTDLEDALALADIVIASTGSESYLVTHAMLRSLRDRRKFRPLFLVDIAVPRNIDPAVSSLEDVYLYDIDDLDRLAQENLKGRLSEVQLAEDIAYGEVKEFESWIQLQQVKPVLIAIRERVTDVVRAELGKNQTTLPEQALQSLVAKLLHPTMAEIKRAAEAGNREALAVIERTFGLNQSSIFPSAPGTGAEPEETEDSGPKRIGTDKR